MEMRFFALHTTGRSHRTDRNTLRPMLRPTQSAVSRYDLPPFYYANACMCARTRVYRSNALPHSSQRTCWARRRSESPHSQPRAAQSRPGTASALPAPQTAAPGAGWPCGCACLCGAGARFFGRPVASGAAHRVARAAAMLARAAAGSPTAGMRAPRAPTAVPAAVAATFGQLHVAKVGQKVEARVDQPRLDVHGDGARRGGDGEQVCAGAEGKIGHVRAQDQ